MGDKDVLRVVNPSRALNLLGQIPLQRGHV